MRRWVVALGVVCACGIGDLRDPAPVTEPPVAGPPAEPPPAALAMTVVPPEVTVTRGLDAKVTVRVPDRGKLASVLNVTASNLPLGVTIDPENVGQRTDEVAVTVRAGAAAEPGKSVARLTLTSIRGDESVAPLGISVRGAPGTADTSFAGFGALTFRIKGGTTTVSVRGLALASGDRIVLLLQYGSSFVVRRFMPDGLADVSFSGDGAFESTPTDVSYEVPTSLAIDPAGATYVSGNAVFTSDGAYTGYVVKLTPTGDLDTSYATGGRARLPSIVAAAMRVDAEGRAAVGGSSRETGRTAIARLDASGALDASFDTAWLSGDDRIASVSALALAATGRVVVAGQGAGGAAVGALRSDGALDLSYGDRGFCVIGRDLSIAQPLGLALDAEGRAVLAATSAASGGRAASARVDPRGFLDAAYGDGGVAVVPLASGSASGRAVAVDGQARVLVVGDIRSALGASALLERWTVSGAPDATFGAAGRAYAAPTVESLSHAWSAIAIASNGRIVVAGTSSQVPIDVVVARYWD